MGHRGNCRSVFQLLYASIKACLSNLWPTVLQQEFFGSTQKISLSGQTLQRWQREVAKLEEQSFWKLKTGILKLEKRLDTAINWKKGSSTGSRANKKHVPVVPVSEVSIGEMEDECQRLSHSILSYRTWWIFTYSNGMKWLILKKKSLKKPLEKIVR